MFWELQEEEAGPRVFLSKAAPASAASHRALVPERPRNSDYSVRRSRPQPWPGYVLAVWNLLPGPQFPHLQTRARGICPRPLARSAGCPAPACRERSTGARCDTAAGSATGTQLRGPAEAVLAAPQRRATGRCPMAPTHAATRELVARTRCCRTGSKKRQGSIRVQVPPQLRLELSVPGLGFSPKGAGTRRGPAGAGHAPSHRQGPASPCSTGRSGQQGQRPRAECHF